MNENKKMPTILPRFNYEPRTLDEAMKMAEYIAKSDLAPKDFRDKPGNVLVAMQMGHELGLKPMQSIQNIAIINGRPSVWGSLGKAILLSKGYKIKEMETEEIKKASKAECVITRPDGQIFKGTFSVEDAKTAKLWGKVGSNGYPTPWVTYPYNQLRWRAFWFVANAAAADDLKGLAGREEVEDYVDTQLVPDDLGDPKAKPEPKEQAALPAPENPQQQAQPTPTNGNGELTEPEMRKEISRMLLEAAEGKPELAKKMLLTLTTFKGNDGKDVAGVDTTNNLSGARLKVNYEKIKRQYQKTHA